MKAPKFEQIGEVLFTRDEAPGAIPNGTLIEKCQSRSGDGNPDGTRGRVVGSLGPAPHPDTGELVLGYFVHWDNFPIIPVFVCGDRIRKVGS